MVSLNVLFLFFKSFFFDLFGVKSQEQIAFKSLFGKSFRIPEKDNQSLRFIFFVLKNTLKKIRSAQIDDKKYTATASAIYDLHPANFELRNHYIKTFEPTEDCSVGFYKDELLNGYYNGSTKFTDSLLFIFLYSIIFPVAVCSKKKGACILISKEMIECIQLIRGIKKKQVSALYFFCIYEKDANFIGLCLNRFGINYYKITSEVPLAVWNRNIIADKLCLCFGYQFEEVERFRESIYHSSILLWGPERSHLVKAIYDDKETIKKELVNSNKKIGFYSTGGWIRKKLGHLDQGFDFVENEIIVLNTLVKCCLHVNMKLCIFLHPREKMEENIEETKLYYSKILSSIDYEFANIDNNTSAMFHSINIAVAFTSTVVFERIYFGFKTLLMPLGFKDFPIPQSKINSICTNSGDELEGKLLHSLSISTNDFFKENNLLGYTNYIWD